MTSAPCFHSMVTVSSEMLADLDSMAMVESVAIDGWHQGLAQRGAQPAGEPRVSVIPAANGISHITVSGPALSAETVGSPDSC